MGSTVLAVFSGFVRSQTSASTSQSKGYSEALVSFITFQIQIRQLLLACSRKEESVEVTITCRALQHTRPYPPQDFKETSLQDAYVSGQSTRGVHRSHSTESRVSVFVLSSSMTAAKHFYRYQHHIKTSRRSCLPQLRTTPFSHSLVLTATHLLSITIFRCFMSHLSSLSVVPSASSIAPSLLSLAVSLFSTS